jgi:YD repeat-containing protein
LASISQQNGAGPLEERVTISNYDGFGNPIQQAKKDDVQHSYIWGYNETYPIAEVANAESEDIAFTSFESDGSGNWIIGSSNRDLVYARTGNKSYSLADGTVSKTGVALGKKYTLSFWAKTGASIIINGATASPSPATAINDWQYYELTVTGSGSVTSVSISGTGIIDELRWLPVGAQMTTYAIDPGVGITAITDPNNATTYYDYDSVGRLKLIKNDKGEIVKMSDYYYQIR